MAGTRRAKPRTRKRNGEGQDFTERAPLNDRQTLFVRFYLDTMNGMRSAIAAGYSARSAGQMASTMLRNPKVRAAIDVGLQERAMGKEEVLSRLSDVGRFDLTQYVGEDGKLDLAEATKRGLLRFVKKIVRGQTGTRLEFHDALAALSKLGEYHKLFAQRLEHTGAGGEPLFPKDCIRIVVGNDEPEEG